MRLNSHLIAYPVFPSTVIRRLPSARSKERRAAHVAALLHGRQALSGWANGFLQTLTESLEITSMTAVRMSALSLGLLCSCVGIE